MKLKKALAMLVSIAIALSLVPMFPLTASADVVPCFEEDFESASVAAWTHDLNGWTLRKPAEYASIVNTGGEDGNVLEVVSAGWNRGIVVEFDFDGTIADYSDLKVDFKVEGSTTAEYKDLLVLIFPTEASFSEAAGNIIDGTPHSSIIKYRVGSQRVIGEAGTGIEWNTFTFDLSNVHEDVKSISNKAFIVLGVNTGSAVTGGNAAITYRLNNLAFVCIVCEHCDDCQHGHSCVICPNCDDCDDNCEIGCNPSGSGFGAADICEFCEMCKKNCCDAESGDAACACGGVCNGTEGIQHEECPVCEEACNGTLTTFGTGFNHAVCSFCDAECDGTDYDHLTCDHCEETCDGDGWDCACVFCPEDGNCDNFANCQNTPKCAAPECCKVCATECNEAACKKCFPDVVVMMRATGGVTKASISTANLLVGRDYTLIVTGQMGATGGIPGDLRAGYGDNNTAGSTLDGSGGPRDFKSTGEKTALIANGLTATTNSGADGPGNGNSIGFANNDEFTWTINFTHVARGPFIVVTGGGGSDNYVIENLILENANGDEIVNRTLCLGHIFGADPVCGTTKCVVTPDCEEVFTCNLETCELCNPVLDGPVKLDAKEFAEFVKNINDSGAHNATDWLQLSGYANVTAGDFVTFDETSGELRFTGRVNDYWCVDLKLFDNLGAGAYKVEVDFTAPSALPTGQRFQIAGPGNPWPVHSQSAEALASAMVSIDVEITLAEGVKGIAINGVVPNVANRDNVRLRASGTSDFNIKEIRIIPQEACDHKGGTATCTERPICTECGNAYGSNLGGHTFSESTCQVKGKCIRLIGEVACGAEAPNFGAHSFPAPTLANCGIVCATAGCEVVQRCMLHGCPNCDAKYEMEWKISDLKASPTANLVDKGNGVWEITNGSRAGGSGPDSGYGWNYLWFEADIGNRKIGSFESVTATVKNINGWGGGTFVMAVSDEPFVDVMDPAEGEPHHGFYNLINRRPFNVFPPDGDDGSFLKAGVNYTIPFDDDRWFTSKVWASIPEATEEQIAEVLGLSGKLYFALCLPTDPGVVWELSNLALNYLTCCPGTCADCKCMDCEWTEKGQCCGPAIVICPFCKLDEDDCKCVKDEIPEERIETTGIVGEVKVSVLLEGMKLTLVGVDGPVDITDASNLIITISKTAAADLKPEVVTSFFDALLAFLKK
jgi:hypothetical protein